MRASVAHTCLGVLIDGRDDMLKFLKRWLGWEEDLEYFNPDDFKPRRRPTAATGKVLSNSTRKPAPPRKAAARPNKAAPPPALNLNDEPMQPHFDPYNTGKFDRSASWERISKNQR